MAFMGEESWKSGLTGFQLNKVADLEGQLAKCKKEKNEKLMQVSMTSTFHFYVTLALWVNKLDRLSLTSLFSKVKGLVF
jgi:hypothetical protein